MKRARTAAMLAAGTSTVLAVALAGCSQPAESDAAAEHEISSLSIATGTTSGVYYPVGGAMAEIISDHVDGVTATAEATGGSLENLRLLESGDSEVAIAQGDVVYQAVNGEGAFDAPIDLRVLMVLYPNVYHGVSLQSIDESLGLDCFADIEGTRFSVGAPGSGNEVATDLVFDALGMSFDDVDVQRYAYAETAEALRADQIDAGSWVVGEGHGSLRELEATAPIHLIPMCPDEVDAVTEQYPFYTPHTIAGGTYASVPDDVDTIALWNVLVVDADFPDDLAYELVEAMYGQVAMIDQVYEPGAPYFVPDSFANSPVPLHPGAVRYIEEQGLAVPDHLQP
ncbi:TAXI family TRAP transporter solute-binding subunit [Glycomyces sp. YM15]|uniref:TAXI family TRAP transporter solute-binding subunit n=1 Tax=Glycomyces sp. YM15 TaxID=2800446 RepID=UPI001966524A|nr:TAXI family TRAP transporter solute-binding subunit [Glycomyces sp. YM15]